MKTRAPLKAKINHTSDRGYFIVSSISSFFNVIETADCAYWEPLIYTTQGINVVKH
jgi:hypothetical protein